MTKAIIGLGANLERPKWYVQEAIRQLAQHDAIIAQSPLYRSAPVGPVPQQDFINAVVIIKTTKKPRELLRHLLQLENQLGRCRDTHWGPRRIDLDLLLYGEQIINDPDLKVPHPEIKNRAFVILPLLSLCPTLKLPCGTLIYKLAKQPNIQNQKIQLITD